MIRLAVLVWFMAAGTIFAGPLEPRDGWEIQASSKGYDDLVTATLKAIRANKMGVVTQAGPTKAAASRGITIPGNRVIGVFNNRYAVEVLGLSVAAMIEAPIRVYITENADGTGTLSYKTPSLVYAPYMEEGGARLGEIAVELDGVFASIAAAALE